MPKDNKESGKTLLPDSNSWQKKNKNPSKFLDNINAEIPPPSLNSTRNSSLKSLYEEKNISPSNDSFFNNILNEKYFENNLTIFEFLQQINSQKESKDLKINKELFVENYNDLKLLFIEPEEDKTKKVAPKNLVEEPQKPVSLLTMALKEKGLVK